MAYSYIIRPRIPHLILRGEVDALKNNLASAFACSWLTATDIHASELDFADAVDLQLRNTLLLSMDLIVKGITFNVQIFQEFATVEPADDPRAADILTYLFNVLPWGDYYSVFPEYDWEQNLLATSSTLATEVESWIASHG